ncbi:hypothetical protein MCOR02_002581 [Pyricularia oryzae]|nr:hypothetical protein MCOR02_002581 [Pyricularia oryzae]KAI6476892.1 hypothetical protein MCOR17_000793 [Pyricularia oryzae]KAI6481249.1 hypothetical protein MCOR13_010887 [Pyricularia oryzae]
MRPGSSSYCANGILALLALLPTVSSSILYSSSYGGSVSALDLTLASNSNLSSLKVVSSTKECSPDPAWLTLDSANSRLYCVGEGLNTRNGSLSAFATSPDGSLSLIKKVDTIGGPVSSVIYGKGGEGIAAAHYTGSSLTTYAVSDLKLLQAKTWSEPLGPNITRQDAPHPHEATLDPTGRFVVVPDLGSDRVRILAIDGAGGLGLTEVEPLAARPGSGPRHLEFLKLDGKTLMYLVSELDNTVTVYEVGYGDDGKSMSFSEIMVTGTHGDIATPNASAAEIHLSPDNRFLLVSSRFDKAFNIPSFDTTDGTLVPSDTITSFSIDQKTGAISAIQRFPAGGDNPRHFSINKDGSLVASGLQGDGRIVIISRDAETGLLKEFVANAKVEVGVNCVVFA